MNVINIAGLRVNTESKQQILETLSTRLDSGERTIIFTPYSEFLYRALRNPELMELLNSADISIPDGIAMLWAAVYLQIPLTARGYYPKIIQALWQMVYSGASIVLFPKYVRQIIPNKIVGADFFWDLVKLADARGQSVYFLGGFGQTPKLLAEKVKNAFPTLNIVGWSNKNPRDPSIISDVVKAKADFIFVAFGPINQERWIVGHAAEVKAKVAIGLGGTFDYIVGDKMHPPRFMRAMGLEWLYRLITQPHRLNRIWQAVPGLITLLVRYKVFNSMPLRQNVVCVIINTQGKVLVCQRKPLNKKRDIASSAGRKFDNYWQFPQGGLNRGEDLVVAAKREANEETGLSNLEYIKTSDADYQYTWNNAVRPLWTNHLKYSGQHQRIVYLKHLGIDEDVSVDGREFIDYQWVELQHLENVIHSERDALMAMVKADLSA